MFNLNKFKAESEKLKMPEAAVYLFKKFGAAIADIESQIALLFKHANITCGCYTTVGGAAIEEISVPMCKPKMHLTVQMSKLGESPVTVLAAVAEMGKIKITFSADPGTDHELVYKICK